MSKFLRIFLKLIIVLLCNQVLTINAAKTRIVGGKPTTINNHKYLVSLRSPGLTGQLFCGGALVKNNYVLTAAHCVDGLNVSDLNVHGGVTFIDQVGEKRSVEKIFVPQDYDEENYHMDVAVLKLSTPMEGPNVATISMCGHELHVGDDVTVSGWGMTNEYEKNPSIELMTTTVRMMPTTECKENYRTVQELTNTMMCASASVPGATDACTFDSGGPLVHNGQLCGIVSWGKGCANPNYPGIYTNVNQVMEFINKSMMN